jgi:hypothetical protein
VEYKEPVSNEAEFEHWLASAFESERRRLRDRAVAREARESRLIAVPDRTVAPETNKDA